MAERWIRAVAGVFVEERVVSEQAGGLMDGRHLVAVSDPASDIGAGRSASPNPLLVIVSLIGGPTPSELRAMVEAAGIVARFAASIDGYSDACVEVRGLAPPMRRRRQSRAAFEIVEPDGDVMALRANTKRSLVTDAASFHDLDESLLQRSVIVGLCRSEDGPEYPDLFVRDARARLPEALVWAGDMETLAAKPSSSRHFIRALGAAMQGLLVSRGR